MRKNIKLRRPSAAAGLLAFTGFLHCAQAQPVKPAAGKTKQILSQPEKSLVVIPATGPLAGRTIYANSWALLIGVNKYPNLPPDLSLHYAVKDVNDLKDELVRDYGFAPDHITVLTEALATKQSISDALDDLTDSGRVGEDDRVLVYFSGHGQTVNTPLGGDLGFLVPEDAKVDLNRPNNIGPYNRSCLSMSWLRDTLQSCPAKHVLILADACYSGLLAQARAPESLNTTVIAEMASLRARQVVTAGTKGQTSQELGEYGHGAMTYKLLEQLKARAAVKGNIFTASDLFVSLRASVSNLTDGAQLPQLASFGTEGDFLFITSGASDVKPPAPGAVIPERPIASATQTKIGKLDGDITGIWGGKLDFGTEGVLRITISIKVTAGDRLQASLTSLDQGSKPIVLDNIRLYQNAVSFVNRNLDVTYLGTLNGTQITGVFTQHGHPKSLTLTKNDREDAPSISTMMDEQAAYLTGVWKGTMRVGAKTSHVTFHIDNFAAGQYTAFLDSLDQSAFGMVATFKVDGDAFDIQVASIAGRYHGTVAADHQTIQGTWTQNGSTLPLTLQKD